MGNINLNVVHALVAATVVILISIVLLPVASTAIKTAKTANTYANGDTYLEESGTGVTLPAGVDTSTLKITCGDTTPANNAAVCGTEKYPALSAVLDIVPYLLVANLLTAGAAFVVQRRSGSGAGLSQVGGFLSTTIAIVVALILMGVILGQLDTLITTLYADGSGQTVAIVKLLPLIITLGVLVIASTASGAGVLIGAAVSRARSSGSSGSGSAVM